MLTVTVVLAACWTVHLPFFIPTCFANQTAQTTQTEDDVEYGVKAAFIYNFMKFIDWPVEKKAEADKEQARKSPMTIGILGKNPFGQSFAPVLGKTIHGRAIQLIYIESYQEFIRNHKRTQEARTAYQNKYQKMMRQCDILFICQSEEESVAPLFSMVSSHAVLTVSDLKDFAKNGGMIGFVKENKKVRFEINLNVVTREKIKIRSQLIGLARKIYQN